MDDEAWQAREACRVRIAFGHEGFQGSGGGYVSRRNRFFGVIVAVVFAAQFTLSALFSVLRLFQTSADGSLFLEDINAWVQLGVQTVLAVVLWGVAVWAWGRVEGSLPAA